MGTRSKNKALYPVDREKQIVDFKYHYKYEHSSFEWTETKQVNLDQPIE
jgi:hypothetical protein